MNNVETIILIAVILLALFFILPPVIRYLSPPEHLVNQSPIGVNEGEVMTEQNLLQD